MGRAEVAGHPASAGSSYQDANHSGFPWWLLMIGQAWGANFHRTGGRSWAVCELNSAAGPGFHVVLEDHRVFTINPRARNPVQEGDHDISLQWAAGRP